eukprot:scaffold315279_cov18-Tisochrysis_lutea.AAC.2
MNGMPVLEKHLLVPSVEADAEVNAASITINPLTADSGASIIPRSGQLLIECSIEFGEGADAARGVTGTAITLVGCSFRAIGGEGGGGEGVPNV